MAKAKKLKIIPLGGLDEIGKKYKLTKERSRQIIEGAFRKLRTKSMLVDGKFLSR